MNKVMKKSGGSN